MLGISVNRHGNIQSRKENIKQRQPAKKIRPGSEVELYLRRTKWANRSFARPGLMVRNKLCWDRQITQWDFQNNGTLTSLARLSFVLKVPLRYLHPCIRKLAFGLFRTYSFCLFVSPHARWCEENSTEHWTLLYIYRDINVLPSPNQNETEKITQINVS